MLHKPTAQRTTASDWRGRATALGFVIALAALVVFTAVFRYLDLDKGFSNDHFVHLAGAQQMLFGEWPTRDFQDPGLPMMYALSAAAELLLGRTLFAEAILVSCAFAVAAALTAGAVLEMTGARTLALLAAAAEVAIVPRTYGYPKILLYAAAFLLIQRYVSRPTTGRLWAMAACTATAFLFRHDHGLYLGIGGALAVLLTPAAGGWSQSGRRAGTFALMAGGLAAPYVAFIQAHGGVSAYLTTAFEFTAREFERQRLAWPSLLADDRWQAALFYEYYALPVLALMSLAAGRGPDTRLHASRIVPIAVVAMLVNRGFIRDPLATRLPDAIVPAVLLLAWLASRAWQSSRRRITIPAAIVLIALVGRSVAAAGHTVEELDRAGMLVSWRRMPGFVADLTTELRQPRPPRMITSYAAALLLPFVEYVERCVPPDHRLLLVGFMPDVSVLARRPFAGGQSTFVQGYYRSREHQELVLTRLRGEVVPVAVLENPAELEQSFPLVVAYVRSRYVKQATVAANGISFDILFHRTLSQSRIDAETGWPCGMASATEGLMAADTTRTVRERSADADGYSKDSGDGGRGVHWVAPCRRLGASWLRRRRARQPRAAGAPFRHVAILRQPESHLRTGRRARPWRLPAARARR